MRSEIDKTEKKKNKFDKLSKKVVRDNKIDNVKVVFMKKLEQICKNRREGIKTAIKDY